VQLAETQEKKKTKTSIKRKSLKEQQPLLPKRKYTKRIKIEPVAESEHDNKHLDLSEDALKPTEEIKVEKTPLQEKVICEDKPIVVDSLKLDKENKTKIIDQENKTKIIGQENKTKTIGQENKTKTIGQEKTTTNDIKVKEQDAKEEFDKVKPKRKRMTFAKPTIKNSKIFKKETKKELKMKLKEKIRKEKKEAKKEELRIKELKKAEKREAAKKELQLQKSEKKELASKEDKKGSKKDDKCDLKKNQVSDGHKKDLKKEGKTAAARKRAAAAAAEKENLTKNHENTTRRSAAVDAAAKFNPRQSLRRKNSLKDYTFAFDEMLDDAFAHLEADKIPVKRRRKCGATLSPPSPAAPAATGPALPAVKKPKDKDNETIRMRLRSRTRPLLAKQEPKQTAKKNKANAKNKKIPKQRRRKKSLGEKCARPPGADADDGSAATTADDWKDEVYKFKRSLRLPSKLISVVSPPGTVRPDQVSLTSIMNIPCPAKESKAAAKSAAGQQAAAAVAAGKNGKAKRLAGHHLFGRWNVFKGRRQLKHEKKVCAQKMRKKRRKEDAEDVPADGDEDGVDDNENDGDGGGGVTNPPKRVMFKRKFMRKKFRSGFDYIKKKKKPVPAAEKKKPDAAVATAASVPPVHYKPRFIPEIQADIKSWIINKGLGETILHRAARLGARVSSFVSLTRVFSAYA